MSGPRLFTFSLHIPSVPSPGELLRPGEGSTLLHNFISETIAKNTYSSVCIPITNDNWKKRWKEMCLMEHGTGSSECKRDVELQRAAENWRAGYSEAFHRNEVNITRLGLSRYHQYGLILLISGIVVIEEAEGTIGMAADWLELDSPDAWVRYDSELVRNRSVSLVYVFVTRVVKGIKGRDRAGIILGDPNSHSTPTAKSTSHRRLCTCCQR